MYKNILYLFAILTLSMNLFAQVNEEKKVHMFIVNNRTTDIAVKVRMYKVDVNPNTDNYFCWDICYTPASTLSTGSKSIAAGDSTDAFYGYYDPKGELDTSEVKYCFYINGSPLDSICRTFNFSQHSAKENLVDSRAFSPVLFIDNLSQNSNINIYPNPSSGKLNIAHDLKENGMLKIMDMLGKEVYSSLLSTNTDRDVISIDHLNNGVYFCSILSNGKIVQTDKLILSR